MNNDRIDFLILLDRSGSMQARRADHEGGIRSFVADQRAVPGDVRLTFVRFDTTSSMDVAFAEKPLAEVRDEDIELVPRGGTPLLDAVGRTVAEFLPRLSKRTVMLVVTDGEENESREWTKARVKEKVAEAEKAGWKVLYLGANVDAFAEAGGIGIQQFAAMNVADSSKAVMDSYAAVSSNVRGTRAAYCSGRINLSARGVPVPDDAANTVWAASASSNLAFTDEQRAAAAGAGEKKNPEPDPEN